MYRSTVSNPPSEIKVEILNFLALLGAPIGINVGLSDKNLFTAIFQQKSDNFDFILRPNIAIFHTKIAR